MRTLVIASIVLAGCTGKGADGWTTTRAALAAAMVGVEKDIGTPVVGPATGAIVTSVAFNGSGYFAVWNDGRSGINSQVIGTRIDANGVVLDPDGILVCGDGTYASRCSDPVVVWDGTNYAAFFLGGGHGVSGRRISAAGALVDSAPFGITDKNAGSVAAQNNGSVTLVVWSDNRNFVTLNQGFDIFGARVIGNAPADPLVPDFPISTAAWDQNRPRVAYAGDKWLVVWEDHRVSPATGVYGARIQEPSAMVLDPSGIAIASSGLEPSVASDGTDFFVVGDGDFSGPIKGTRVTANGSVLDTAGIDVCTRPFAESSPTVAFAGGSYQVVWTDPRAGLFGGRVAPATGALLDSTDGLRLDSGAVTDLVIGPRVAPAGNAVYVAWTRGAGAEGHANALGSRYSFAAGLQDAPGTSLARSANGQRELQLASGGADQAFAVWYDDRNGAVAIYGTRLDANGTPLDPAGILLSNGGVLEETPAVAFNGTNYLAIWADQRAPRGVWGTRIDPTTGTVLDPGGLPLFTETNGNRLYVPNQYPTVVGKLAVASDGTNWFVAWEDSRSGTHIYGGRVSPSGTVIDPPGVALTAGVSGPQQRQPQIAYGAGTYFVAFLDYDQNSLIGLSGARVTAATGVVQDPAGIRLDKPLTPVAVPAVVYASPNFLIAFRGGDAIELARVVSSNGAAAGPVALTDGNAFGAEAPAIAFDGNVALLTYARFPSGNSSFNVRSISGTRLLPDGSDLDSTDFDIAATPGLDVGSSIGALTGSGRFLVGYDRYDGTVGITAMRAKTRVVVAADPTGDGGTPADARTGDVAASDAPSTLDAAATDMAGTDTNAADAGIPADAGAPDSVDVDAAARDADAADATDASDSGDAHVDTVRDTGTDRPVQPTGDNGGGGCGCEAVPPARASSWWILAALVVAAARPRPRRHSGSWAETGHAERR